MRNELTAVSDSGPVIHLRECDAVKAFNIFSKIFYPQAVFEELSKRTESLNVLKKKIFEEKKLNNTSKKKAEFIYLKYKLSLAESEAIALNMQEKIELFLTDDLEARTISKEFNLKPVGSIGILLRAFKEKILTKQELMLTLKKIEDSSLFITQKLVNQIISEIEKFEKIR